MLLLPFGNAFGFVRLHAAKPARQTNVSVSMPLGIAACYCRGPAMTTTRGGCLPTVLADSPARQNLACRLDSSKMRTFGGFKSGERFFYGEIRSEDVQVLAKPYWSDIVPTGEMYKLADVDVADVPIELRQNGQTRQCGRTSQMIYSPAQIVAFVSEAMTLLPGDVILTGTPSGVGPLTAGDELEARIDDWPPLRNRVVNAR